LHHFEDIINYFPKFKEVTWPWPCPVERLCQYKGYYFTWPTSVQNL